MREQIVHGVVGTRPVLPHRDAPVSEVQDTTGAGTFVCRIQEDRCEPDVRMLALFGLADGRTFSLRDILGTLIHPDDRSRLAGAFAKAIEPGGTRTLCEEIRVLHADGSVRWLSIIGRTTFEEVANSTAPAEDGCRHRAVQMSGMAADITDRKRREAKLALLGRRAEEALRDSERRWSEELADTQLLQRLSAQLIEGHGSDSLYETIVDAATVIMRSEYATMQMLHPKRGTRGELRLVAAHGFSNEEKEAWKWVRAEAATTCALALRTGRRFVATDVAHCEPMIGTEDQKRLLKAGIRAAQSTPLVSRGGRMLGMITTHWVAPHQPSERDLRLLDILARQAADLMEREQAEDALRRSENQLKEADRRKDEFLATLAHELRNPLAPLRTGLELIRLAGDSRGAIEEARLMMERQVVLLVRLVDDLLDLSRITSGKIRLQRSPMPLADLVAMAVQANRGALEAAKLALRIDIPERDPVIDADAPRFVQIVSNVLHNAIKFTDPGGRISIAAEATTSPDTDAKEVALVISDSGVGISPDMLPRIFDLFTQDDATAQRSNTGLGLGLALARRLIELHGGSIDAHSDGEGRGSTFTLRMPLSDRIPDARPTSPTPAVPLINRRVVVIDDNAEAARSIQRLVAALGGECEVAHDGETGLAHVRRLQPDVVLLDIGMPGLDGYETCRRIRQEFGPDLMIVALTGWGQEHDKRMAMQSGFNIHLTKPADPLMLEALLAGRPRIPSPKMGEPL